MTLSHYQMNKSQHELGQRLRPYQHPQGIHDDKSVTLAELAEFTKELGFTPYHRPAGDIDLIKRALSQDIPVITRTWLESNSDIGHFRVITGFNDTKGILVQDDSLQGSNLEYSYSAFNDLWRAFNYEFLILLPPEKNHLAPIILGNLHKSQDSWQQALDLSQQALIKNPADIYAGFNQSVALYHVGQYQQSVKAFETVRYRLPTRMLWYQLEPLLAYYATGGYDQVISLSQEILTADNPAYSELHYLQGKIHQIRGDISNANESFRLAHTYNHDTGFWLVNVK
jgi:tetratricopeptide (TPR) repeat protein